MATKAQKIRVGAFVVVTAALLSIVLIVFGGVRFWQKESTYHIVFEGSVYGLEKGAPVHLNGMRVGRVEDIKAAPGDLEKVLVTIIVKEKTPVHADTVAVLQFAGITGLKVIDLRGGTLRSPLLPPDSLITQGETILDKLEKQAKEITEQSSELMANANQIVKNLALITDPKKFDGIEKIVDAAQVTAGNLAATSITLHTMVNENRAVLKSSLANIDAATKSVDAATKSAATLMDTHVAGLIGKAGQFVAGLENIVRSNEGQLRSTVFDLRQASRNFKELSRDLRQKPSRLLFSNTPGERKLP